MLYLLFWDVKEFDVIEKLQNIKVKKLPFTDIVKGNKRSVV